MLSHIYIRDFVIIEHLELEFSPGMTALTGETGAGKSILIDAIGLALGDRADSGLVRANCDRAEIGITLDLADAPGAKSWLQSHDFEVDDECLIRRIVTKEGRSRAYINGSTATLGMLRELGEQLVNIHGQHAHQALGRRDYQREIIDLQAGQGELLKMLSQSHQAWKQTKARLEELALAENQRQERLDFLGFLHQELLSASPRPGEYAELIEQHARLAHASQLEENVQRAHSLLFDNEIDAHGLLSQALDALESSVHHDATLKNALELVVNARIEIDEAATELRHYLDHLELDPESLADVEARLAQLQSLARKHRCEPGDLPERLAAIEEELNLLTHADAARAEMEKNLEALDKEWRSLAARISQGRAERAKALEKEVNQAMQVLGMEGGRFVVSLQSDPDTQPNPFGYDQIEFQVSANAGQPPQALAKVASGGELSRISLAIQLAAKRDRRLPTLIFDEVDTGIGGGIAEIVGKMLRQLSERHQILCVTHLPQVAAQAHHQLSINKIQEAGSTRTLIRVLDGEERIDELARMLGGVRLTKQTRAHAAEMLQTAQSSATPEDGD